MAEPRKPLSGQRVDVLRGFRYLVTITPYTDDGTPGNAPIAHLGFSKVSGLNLGTSDVIEYREGNDIVSPIKLPGLNKYDNITLEQGRAKGNAGKDLAQWRAAVVWSQGGKGGTSPDGDRKNQGSFSAKGYRANVEISLINREGAVAIKWQIARAWPINLKFSDLDGNTSDVLIQTLELATEGIEEVVVA